MKEVEYKFVLRGDDKNKLVSFLNEAGAKLKKQESQDNWYYKAPGDLDLRLRRTDNEAYLILKKGWMHNENREETEVPINKNDFEATDSILRNLGYEYDTKWARTRYEYHLNGYTVVLDNNVGYGWVAEIERRVREGTEKHAQNDILQLAKKIGIEPTPKEHFDKMYAHYKQHWRHYMETGEVFDVEKIINNN